MKSNKFGKLSGKQKKIAIVQSRFNDKITNSLTEGAMDAFKETGVLLKNIDIILVPGAFEIPLACKKLSEKKRYDGIIAIGAVIKGETAHFEYICKAATDGIMRVSLDSGLPISFAVITTYNEKQALARAGKNKKNKGYEAAMALIEQTKAIKNIK